MIPCTQCGQSIPSRTEFRASGAQPCTVCGAPRIRVAPFAPVPTRSGLPVLMVLFAILAFFLIAIGGVVYAFGRALGGSSMGALLGHGPSSKALTLRSG